MPSLLNIGVEKTVADTEINERKKALRKMFSEMRRALTDAERETYSAELSERICDLREFKDAENVLSFWPLSTETDVIKVNKAVLSLGKRLLLPKCVKGTREMHFYEVRSLCDLEKGSFSIMEPRDGCKLFTPKGDGKTVCIVPALAFDRDGYRLGYGGGFYDRYLSSYDMFTVGAVYHPFVTEEALPRDSYDVRVDVIATDKETFVP